ncbi:hypothetical protein CTA1_2885, partial [Colletotrichum tanaceti]
TEQTRQHPLHPRARPPPPVPHRRRRPPGRRRHGSGREPGPPQPPLRPRHQQDRRRLDPHAGAGVLEPGLGGGGGRQGRPGERRVLHARRPPRRRPAGQERDGRPAGGRAVAVDGGRPGRVRLGRSCL